jgi:hypothetical protein
MTYNAIHQATGRRKMARRWLICREARTGYRSIPFSIAFRSTEGFTVDEVARKKKTDKNFFLFLKVNSYLNNNGACDNISLLIP